MKINWSKVARSDGYLSMKDVVAVQANSRFSNDDRYQKAFAFAIGRAKQYAVAALKGIGEYPTSEEENTKILINQLDLWETYRKQSFLSYYSNYNLSKRSSRVLKTPGIRSRIKYYKTDSWYKNSNKAAKELSTYLQKIRTKKARWTKEHKDRARRYRQLSP